MKTGDLVRRGLAFHAGAHAATLGGVAVASAVLVGALALGDSVRASRARAAQRRLGRVDAVLGNGERFFTRELARRLEQALPGLVVAPAIQLPAVVATPDDGKRVDDAQLLGVEPGFFALSPAGVARELGPEEACVGAELARRLALVPGDELVLRTSRPSVMTRELALATLEDAVLPLRVRVAAVLGDEEFGAFALEGGVAPRANLFVAEAWLAERLGVAGRVNRCFLRGAGAERGAHAERLAEVQGALRACWELADVGLELRALQGVAELRSDQVFLAPTIVAALGEGPAPVLAVLAYFVNELRHGERATPYSTVAALGSPDGRPAADLGGWRATLPELAGDEIVLNEWAAGDLAASAGDEVSLRYFVLDSGRRLREESHTFRVMAVVPSAGIGADPTLMPDFPGMGDAENCRDWDPGLPLDLAAIRDQDEEYWDRYRGAPKAFVGLETARLLWSNRFGSFTAVRVPADQGDALRAALRARVDPGALGLPLRSLSASVEASSDFGGLFLGLSLFLIVSSLLLTGLFFAFSLERRASELGVLRVTGFLPGALARLQLGEALILCALGALLGSLLGMAYTRLLLVALERWWRDAIGRTELEFHVTAATLVLGGASSIVLALAAVWGVLRRSLRVPPLRLLWGELVEPCAPASSRRARVALVLWGCTAVAAFVGALATRGGAAGGLAFGSGLACLVTGLLLVKRRLAVPGGRARSTLALGWSNAARSPARSVTTVALVASSVFLLVVAGGNRQGPTPAETPRASGTGGFEFLGRSALPVFQDLAAPAGQALYGLRPEDLAGVEWVPLRVRAGDEASCLNLDKPESPRLLGVDAHRLAGRFRFAATSVSSQDPWGLLELRIDPDERGPIVPAIVDAVSLQWTLHRKLGDDLELVDGRGAPFRARVVATLADSMLQGDVLLGERDFERLFPEESGHRAFLVDVPADRAQGFAASVSRALRDEGLVLVPARERLDLLHGVQNTYLAIFQALGGLGLVLGSAGLLALVLRSVSERRGELALLRALGFTRHELTLLFLGEHGALVWIGLALGVLAGAGVVVPTAGLVALDALRTLVGWILLVGLLGLAWVWIGARLALSGALLPTLQRE